MGARVLKIASARSNWLAVDSTFWGRPRLRACSVTHHPIIAVNKTDLLANDRAEANRAWRKLRDRLETSFSQVKGVPIVGISALTGRGLERLNGLLFSFRDYAVIGERL